MTTTPSQTVGPFFHIGCNKMMVSNLAGPNVSGTHITIEGLILDGDKNPVPDAMIEIWQANSSSKYPHLEDKQDKLSAPEFRGFGRTATDQNGRFRFTTIKPGPVPGLDGSIQAPHLMISIFMRGLMKRLVSRMYFPGESTNTSDPVLNLVDPIRRETLIARAKENSPEILHWDVILQGKDETVFFDI
jgi:protocatechuate 3,4-dioxygenase alpha subunit